MRTPAALLCASLLVVGCASGRDPAASDIDAEIDRAAGQEDRTCRRRSTVTVHVDNRSSLDMQLAFGPYSPARAALGFSRTTYTIPRSYVEDNDIVVRIARGGLAVEGPAEVLTEFVVCNDATLLIGSRPAYSFFHGDLLREPVRDADADEAGDPPSAPEPPERE